MLTVGVLYGGRSGEHDVSLCSAASIVAALDPQKYRVVAIGIERDGRWHVQERPVIIEDRDFGRKLALEKKGVWLVNHFPDDSKLHLYNIEDKTRVSVDVVFPAVHGTNCEDGTLQGLLELSMVPFVGSDTIGSCVGIDKDISKRLLAHDGIPVVPWITVSSGEWADEPDRMLASIGERLPSFPLFVKPVRCGSSVGVKKVIRGNELAEAINYALRFDNKLLVEEGIDGREIECAVLGNSAPRASALGEVVPTREFYSYEAKYLDPGGARLVIPAPLDNDTADSIRATAVRAYRVLGTSGMARVDFFLDERCGRFYVNEINTLPGFTSISMYPKLWEHSGIPYSRLIDMLIDLAIERHRERMKIRTDL